MDYEKKRRRNVKDKDWMGSFAGSEFELER